MVGNLSFRWKEENRGDIRKIYPYMTGIDKLEACISQNLGQLHWTCRSDGHKKHQEII